MNTLIALLIAAILTSACGVIQVKPLTKPQTPAQRVQASGVTQFLGQQGFATMHRGR